MTNRIASLWRKRYPQINGYLSQTVGLLFEQINRLNVDTVVMGYHAGWKQESHVGKKTNQEFVQIPFHRLISAIENKCLKEGIRFVKQEESYTSKARFLDHDDIPVWSKGDNTMYSFSGKRLYRGFYRCKNGPCIHADIHAWDEKTKINTPMIMDVQKHKAVASRIA